MTMTFVHKAATAVLLVAAATGAQAVETYSEDFNSLFFDFKNKTGDYGGTNVLAGYSGTSFSGGWSEIGAVDVWFASASDRLLVIHDGDAMTFNFTLASNPSVSSYDLSVSYKLGGTSGAVTVETSFGMAPTSQSFSSSGLTDRASVGPLDFSGLTAGTYGISFAGIGGSRVSLDDFSFSVTPSGGVSAVPEPGSYALMGAGLLALGASARRRGSKSPASRGADAHRTDAG